MRIRLPSSAFRRRSAAFWPVRVIAAPRRTRSRWEGRIVSLTGATDGFPTMEEAKADGLFHPNCTHRIEYLDEDETAAALTERDKRLGRDKPDEAGGEEQPPEQPKKAKADEAGEAHKSYTGFEAINRKIREISSSVKNDISLPAEIKALDLRPIVAEHGPLDDMRAIQANATDTNCAFCTIAMEARARGLDALSKKVRLEDIVADLNLSVVSWEPESCFTDAKMLECDKETHEEAQKWFSDATSSFGDGGRGILLLEWLSGKRHAVSILHRDGETFVLDSQNQKVSSAEYLRRCIPNSIRVFRTDNLELTGRAGSALVAPTK